MTALAQSGLFYAVNEYDTDRYRKLGALAADLLASVTDQPAAHWQLELGRDTWLRHPQGRRPRRPGRRPTSASC